MRITAALSVCVEGRDQRVLKRGVLGRLLQVAVHLARRREDAFDSRRGGRRSKILLDHSTCIDFRRTIRGHRNGMRRRRS